MSNKETYSIKDINIESKKNLNLLMKDLDNFLGPYTDCGTEMVEAIDEALENGFIFEAVDNKKNRLGIVVITRTPFKSFQPKYHLAYIATSPKARGKGIGKILLEESQKRTDNDIALHVSPSNENAIGFYEKFGWEIKYIRMMPSKEK